MPGSESSVQLILGLVTRSKGARSISSQLIETSTEGTISTQPAAKKEIWKLVAKFNLFITEFNVLLFVCGGREAKEINRCFFKRKNSSEAVSVNK